MVHTHFYNSNLIWRTVSRRVDEVIPSDHPRYTHYYNSNLIQRTVSRRVDEVISLDHPRREASRVIQLYDLIHET